MHKRGQFFLIAALVIVLLILSVGTIYNSAKVQREDTKVSDLSNEIGYESAKVLDSGVYTSLNQEDINNHVAELAGNYSSTYSDSDFIIVYGNATDLEIYNYTSCTSLGEVSLGAVSTEVCTGNETITDADRYISADGKKLTLLVGGIPYVFNLEKGQNFYIIVKRYSGGESFISSS